METISIVMPFYRHWTMTHQRIMELHKHIPDTVEIVLVNDFSQDDSIDSGVAWWQKACKHSVIYVKNKKNLGFGGSMNKGVRNATGSVIVLLSNDVQVAGDFVAVILQKLNENEKVLIGGTLRDYDTGWNTFEISGERKTFEYVEGWLLACTRDTWNDLGGFDPIYSPYDVEDIDLSTTALQKGYELVGLELRYMLRHFSGQTIRKVNPNREEITRRNQKKFLKKWSKILVDENTS